MNSQIQEQANLLSEEVAQKLFQIMEEQGFGEEKTNQIKEKLAKTNFFQWFDAYKATQNKP